MAKPSASQKAQLRRLGYTESQVNGMSQEAAKRALMSKRVVDRTQREPGPAPKEPTKGLMAPEETPKPRSSVPVAGGPDSKPPAPTPRSSVPVAGGPDSKPRVRSSVPPAGGPDTAPAEKLSDWIKGTSTEETGSASKTASKVTDTVDRKGSKIIADFAKGGKGGAGAEVLAYLSKLTPAALADVAKVAGPIAAVVGTLADTSPTNEGEDESLSVLKRDWENMEPADRMAMLQAQVDKAHAETQPKTGMVSLADAAKSAGENVRAFNQRVKDDVRGRQKPAEPAPSPVERLVPPTESATPTPVAAPANSAPAETLGDMFGPAPTNENVAVDVPGNQMPAPPPGIMERAAQRPDFVPTPGQKPNAPSPSPAPSAAPARPQIAQTPESENRVADEKNLGDMLSFMKKNGVQGFAYNGMVFAAGDTPSGYHLVEQPQQNEQVANAPGPGVGTGGLY